MVRLILSEKKNQGYLPGSTSLIILLALNKYYLLQTSDLHNQHTVQAYSGPEMGTTLDWMKMACKI